MVRSTETSLEARIEQLERQLAAARGRARWLATGAGCVAAVLACRPAKVSDEKSLRELTIGSVRIDEFGITITDTLGKTELKATGVSVGDHAARLTSSLGSGRLELRQKDGANAALDVTSDASLGLQSGTHEAALRVGDDHCSLVLEHDGTHTASLTASVKLTGVDAVSGNTNAGIRVSTSAEITAKSAGHRLRLVADNRGSRTETENTEARPDGAAAKAK
jgi:hypothetical protein